MLREDATGRYADLGWTRVHYNDAGEGPALVFTIGYAPGTSAWLVYHKVIGALSRRFRCLLLDPPNAGRSDAFVLKGEPRSTMYARAIRDLLDGLGIERATIVDMAFGAQVGPAYALDYPDRVDRLVLHACALRMPPIFYNGPTDAMQALQAAFADPTIATMRAMMHLYLHDGASYDDRALMLEERLAAWRARPELDAARRASDNIARSLADELRAIRAPALLLSGRDDRVLGGPEGALALLNYLDDARLVILNRCGHWIPFERPDEFSRLVESFCDVGSARADTRAAH